MEKTQNDYEIINGKPYLGMWFGTYIRIAGDNWTQGLIDETIKRLELQMNWTQPKDTELRHIQIIMKNPVDYFNPINFVGTLAIKYMIWGRAWKVMKLIRKKVKRYAKRRISGRQRRVRIDR